MHARLSELYREKRRATTYIELARDIACCLYERCTKSVVVTDKPLVSLALVSKQWKQMERRLTNERTSMLDVQKIQGLTREIAWIQTRKFSVNADPEAFELLEAGVIFATVKELLRFAPECQALYVTCPISKEQLYMITAWMPRDGRIIIYKN
jgi:hypothetical protein